MRAMNKSRVRDLIQFALLTAGTVEDVYELGPIHVLKYMYLADLAWAETHGGETWTGIPWRFHHFGPWDEEAWGEIDPTVRGAGGEVRKFDHPKAEDDTIRYSLEDDEGELLRRISAAIPLAVKLAVKHGVHEYGSDTSGLLHHVYVTPPMLNAAPGEPLNFSTVVPPHPQGEVPTHEVVSEPAVSVKERKRRREKIEQVRAQLQARREAERLAREADLASMDPRYAPRYDDVWAEGVAWLESLAGGPAPAGGASVHVGEGIWHSAARRNVLVP